MDRETTTSPSSSQYSNKEVNQLYAISPHVWEKLWLLFLLNLITSPNNPGTSTHMMSELDSSDDEFPEIIEGPYELPKNDNEWIDSISSTRKNDRMTAIQNIKENQKVQKKTYDRNTKLNETGKQLT